MSLPPAPSPPRYASLDLWRGIACLMIVIGHSAHSLGSAWATDWLTSIVQFAISKFGIGVPIFFVVSGYCIAATSDSIRTGSRASADFFYRRFRRIFPPYWAAASFSMVMVVVLSAAGHRELVSLDYGFLPHPAELSLSQWLGNVTLTETWRPHLFGSPELKILGPAWTLCYEEQFYAVCGLILIFARRRFFGVAALMTGLCVIIAPLGFVRPELPIRGFFLDGRWLMFAEGLAVYYAIHLAPARRTWVAAFAAALILAAGVRWGIPSVTANVEWRAHALDLVASTAFALGILLLHPWDERIARLPVTRPFAYLGRMCYSLYLIHWPITVMVTAFCYREDVRGPWPTLLIVVPLSVGLSIATAYVFHILVERRFLGRTGRAGGVAKRGWSFGVAS